MIESILVLIIALSCIYVVYVYFGFPILLITISRLFRRPAISKTGITPSLTMIISCYNEQEVIEAKIKNTLALSYPKDQLQILFVSDGSEDRTEEIVRQYEGRGITLLRQEGRLGKTSGINLAMKKACGEVIVFSDANSMYEKDALLKLVAPFVESDVGYVVGAALYTDSQSNDSARGEASYWSMELALKEAESNLASVVGGDGAIYAIRKNLYVELNADDINDFVNPLQIIVKGYRGVFEPSARCYEETAGDFKKECRRKRRIVNRSLRGLLRVREVLNPLEFGLFSVFVWSHKLLRWFAPFILILLIACITMLALWDHRLMQTASIGLASFASLAYTAYILDGRVRLPTVLLLPYYFVMVNWSSMLGIIDAFRGKRHVIWQTSRTDAQIQPSYHSAAACSAFLVVILLCGIAIYSVLNLYNWLFVH